MKRPPIALTIAGSDSGGGAGIQADLKTFMAFGVYGMSAITAITAQNTCGVSAIQPVNPDVVEKQIHSVLSDIGADAVKTGMLSSSELVSLVAVLLQEYNVQNLVVDTVMIAKSGDHLLAPEAIDTLREKLIPLAYVITPNLREAEVLTGLRINNLDDMKKAAVSLKKAGAQNIIVKGGHLEDAICTDILYDGINFMEFAGPKRNSMNTHGTGCTFSSAITAGLAKGKSLVESVSIAKEFISRAIEAAYKIGKGHGPTNHLVDTNSRWNG